MKKILAILGMILVIGGVCLVFLPTKTYSSERSFNSAKISNLKKISVSGKFDVNVTISNSNNIKCRFSTTKSGFVKGEPQFGCKIENNVLYITTNSKVDSVCILGSESLKLDINIPKDYEKKLFINKKLSKKINFKR